MDDSMIVSSKFPDLVRVRSVETLHGFIVRVKFTDGTEREVDLEPYLQGPIFEAIRRNPEVFRSIYIDHGALAWPNGADIDPDTLYYNGNPPWATEEKEREQFQTRSH